MADRFFDFKSQQQDGRIRKYTEIECGKCGQTGATEMNGPASHAPPEVVRKKFQQQGWKVGRTARQDRCPDCLEAARNDRKKIDMPKTAPVPPQTREVRKEAGNVVAISKTGVATKMAEEPMPEGGVPPMSRTDRRIIFGDIDEVYESEDAGYQPGHSDETVAKTLGVRVEWVRQVRTEMFGPAEGTKRNREIREIKEAYTKAEKNIAALLDDAQQIMADMNDINTRIRALEKE